MWVVLLEVVGGELTYVLLHFLNAFNSSFNSFTLTKATLIHSKEFVAIGSKHLGQKGVIIEVFSIAMDVVHHSFFLNVSLNWVAICGNRDVIFSLEVIGFRPDELFVVDEFIVVLPIFKSYSVSVFVFHILASHVSCNSS